MKYGLLAFRNSIDFFLRNQIKLSRSVPENAPTPERDERLQREFKEFFDLFPWSKILERIPQKPLVVTDIGARNFVFGPVIDDTMKSWGRDAEIHGIEIDAHRLLWGFHSRADYGNYYAKKMRSGFFHADDFLNWNRATDIALLLNPFVSKEPLLSWGLPISKLQPETLFQHVMKTLKPNNGVLLLSCPSPEELQIAQLLASKAGFIAAPHIFWAPQKNSIQQKPRYGVVYYSALS